MALPKTHPLYGATEVLENWLRFNCWKSGEDAIRALESAGYRVVGPESIPDIAEAAGNHAWTTYKHKGQWEWQKLLRISIAAAPTITGTEKGG